MAINFRDSESLLANDCVARNNEGQPMRQRGSYKKDWSKIIGKNIIVHNAEFLLLDRVKIDGVWCLVYTNGILKITESYDNAVWQANISRSAIIEKMPQEEPPVVEVHEEPVVEEIIEQIMQEEPQSSNTNSVTLIDVRYANKAQLLANYPVFTKAGNIWRNRVNWLFVEIEGNFIECNFGVFTFVRAERINKVWYWTIADSQYEYTIKRDQARHNKRMPRNAVRERHIDSSQRILPGFEHLVNRSNRAQEEPVVEESNTDNIIQLCLPAPRTIVEMVFDQVMHLVRNYNDVAEDWQDLQEAITNGCIDTEFEIFEEHVNMLVMFSSYYNARSVFSAFLHAVHPDRGHDYPTEYIECIHNAFTCIGNQNRRQA